MDRRGAIQLAVVALAAPGTVFGQSPKRVYRVAILDDTSEGTRRESWMVFRKRLSELGLSEGKNLVYEARYAGGEHDRLPSLAAELVKTKPDVIVTASAPPTRVAMRATATIPIVFAGAGDPVGTGFVASLSRPGGNVTGISTVSPETTQKSLELLRELSPGVQRIVFLTDPASPTMSVTHSRLIEHGSKLKLSIRMLDGVGQVALQRAFATIRQEKIQGLLVGSIGTLLEHRDEVVQFVAREKLPTVYGREEWARGGGLVSYGTERGAAYRRVAEFVHRILNGSNPADIPVEQLTDIRLIVNMKAARTLGVTIPNSIRARADEVIE